MIEALWTNKCSCCANPAGLAQCSRKSIHLSSRVTIFIIIIECLCYAGAGAAASVKDAVRAALGQEAIAAMSPSGNALALAEEQRVRFWSRPALDSPSLQQRVWHAWGAVQSPTGTPPDDPGPFKSSCSRSLLINDFSQMACILVYGA